MLEIGILLVSIVGNLILADLAYRAHEGSHSNRLFVFFEVVTVLWLIANYLSIKTYDIFWVRAVMFLATSQIGSLFLFVHTFPNAKIQLKRAFLYPLIFVWLVLLGLSFTPLIFSGIENKTATPGPAIPLFGIYAIGLLIGVVVLLIRKKVRSSGILKQQLVYLSLGIITTFILIALSNFLFVVLLDNTTLLVYSPAFTLILAGAITYAIEAHHLFDVRVLLTQVATALVVFAMFVQTLAAPTLNGKLTNGGVLLIVSYGGYLLIKSVVQEIKRREQIQQLAGQLKIANDHLKELDRMKTEFVSLASHELLTPISAIEGYLSMLLDEKIVDPKSSKGLEYLNRIYGSAKRLAKLVTDLLNVSRIEEGRLLIQSKALDINQVIDTVIGELRFKAKERNLDLQWQSSQSPLVYSDDDKVKEVVVNLIGNAIKYTQIGSITVTAEVITTPSVQEIDRKQQEFLKTPAGDESLSHRIEPERRALVGDKQLVVHVTDTGIGIPPEEINNVFRKFYRIGDITTQQTQGTGLGLYISRSLVEMMHGRMWVQSAGRGKGSTFSFSLPLSVYEPQIKHVEQSIKVADTAKPLAHSSQFEF